MEEILLQTKLFALPARPLTIPRPHLFKKLNNGLSGKLTLVSAPPGFGKNHSGQQLVGASGAAIRLVLTR